MPTLQEQIDATPDGGTCVIAAQTGGYGLSGSTPVLIDKNITIDFGKAKIVISNSNSFTTGGLKIAPPSGGGTLNRVVLKNANFEGGGSYGANASNGPVIYTDPAIKLDLLQVESCVFRNISYGCNIDCTGTNAYIRSAIVCKNLFDGIFKNTGVTTSIATRFALNGSNGLSYGNTFRTLKEYGIKVDNGGPFLSLGDSFFDQTSSSSLHGALFLSGGPHLRAASGYLQNCKRGVVVQPVDGADCRDVSINDCTFVDGPADSQDIFLNKYLASSTSTDMYSQVTVVSTRHYSSQNTNEAVRILAFNNMLVRNVLIARTDTTAESGSIHAFGYGASKQLTIDGVRFRYSTTPSPFFGFKFEGLIFSGTGNKPEVILKNIDFKNETADQDDSINPAGTAPTPYGNDHFKIAQGTYWNGP